MLLFEAYALPRGAGFMVECVTRLRDCYGASTMTVEHLAGYPGLPCRYSPWTDEHGDSVACFGTLEDARRAARWLAEHDVDYRGVPDAFRHVTLRRPTDREEG